MLSRHPSDQDLVLLSEKFQSAYVPYFIAGDNPGSLNTGHNRIERIRDSGVEIDYSNAARLSSLLRVAAGKFKSLTAREVRPSESISNEFPSSLF